jgi:hypothetical protein
MKLARHSAFVVMSMLVFGLGAVAQDLRPAGSVPSSIPIDALVLAQAPAAPPATPPCGPNLPGKNVDKQSRCFELRTYTVRSGSSIDLLHSRFRDHTSALFIKHGMTIVGYWQPVTKPDTLVYLLAYKDNAARDAAWAAFNADPEWVKTRTEMQVSVQVENLFMTATDYSPLK